MTSTRSTIPAPPPKGVSSTCPPLSGVWSRGLTKRSSEPCASALPTWRWPWNHSNHCGNRVTTSTCISGPLLPQELQRDVHPPGAHVHRPDRVAVHRHEQVIRRLAVDLEHVDRRVADQPANDPHPDLAIGHRAALEVL